MTLANGLSIARLLLTPVLLLLALIHRPHWFLAILTLAFLFDLVDGPIARARNQVSAKGAELDSIADFAVYTVFILGACLLWPDIVLRERYFVAAVALSVAVPVTFGVIKFRRPTSLHTWSVKAAAVCMAPAALLLFAQFAVLPFHLATAVCVLAAIEQCIVIALLEKPRSDIKSVFHLSGTH